MPPDEFRIYDAAAKLAQPAIYRTVSAAVAKLRASITPAMISQALKSRTAGGILSISA